VRWSGLGGGNAGLGCRLLAGRGLEDTGVSYRRSGSREVRRRRLQAAARTTMGFPLQRADAVSSVSTRGRMEGWGHARAWGQTCVVEGWRRLHRCPRNSQSSWAVVRALTLPTLCCSRIARHWHPRRSNQKRASPQPAWSVPSLSLYCDRLRPTATDSLYAADSRRGYAVYTKTRSHARGTAAAACNRNMIWPSPARSGSGGPSC
jgi:hypothetical protein